MTPHPLAGAFARVDRAGEHLADLKPDIDAMRQQQDQATFPYFETEPPHGFAVNLPTRADASMRIPILIGEIAYNLRSALDYLIFELAKLDSGMPQKGTQFPIEDTPEGFAHRRKTGWLTKRVGSNASTPAMSQQSRGFNRTTESIGRGGSATSLIQTSTGNSRR